MLADRLRILRQQRPVLRIGQHLERGRTVRRATRRVRHRLRRTAVAPQNRPRPLGGSSPSTVGRCGVVYRTAPAQSISTSGNGRWKVRGRGGRVQGPEPGPTARRGAGGRLRPIRPARSRTRRRHRRRRHRHQRRLPLDEARRRPTWCYSSRANCPVAQPGTRPGLVGQLRASESATRLVQYSTQLYADLESETGLSAGYKQCGGVTVARTEDRMTQLRRTAANAGGVRHGVRTAHSRAGARALSRHAGRRSGRRHLADRPTARPTRPT